ncbi:hypothetical protein Tco_0580510 [Tanacetum coccineum]
MRRLITFLSPKEDYTIVPKPRAIVYRDRNDQRKLMRLNELHKFSDGTLTRVMEKLDQMVKDFHLYEYNKGMETRKWSEDDKRRSKDFITAIEKRLQIRRIYRSLESFVGGRIRDIDYRLINRTTGNDLISNGLRRWSLRALQEQREGRSDDADLERAISLVGSMPFCHKVRAPVGGQASSFPDRSCQRRKEYDQFILVRRDHNFMIQQLDPLLSLEADTIRESDPNGIFIHIGFRNERKLWKQKKPLAPKGDKDQGEVSRSRLRNIRSKHSVSEPEKAGIRAYGGRP